MDRVLKKEEFEVRRGIWFLLFVVWAVILAGCMSSGPTSYQVTGRVVDENGDGIEGVTLTIEGGSTSTVSTDEDGEWVATATGIVTVRPEKEGYVFLPRM